MEYKNVQDNRYRTSFMRSTEALMDKLTVKEFIAYLEKNAEQGESTCEYVDGTVTDLKHTSWKKNAAIYARNSLRRLTEDCFTGDRS